MSDFLTQLGHEVDRAALARSGRRRRRRALVGAVTVLVAAAVPATIVVTSGSDRVANERPAAVDPSDRGPTLPPPPEAAVGVPVTVANGTRSNGLAGDYAHALEAAGWTVGEVTNAAVTDYEVTTVSTDGPVSQLAQQVAGALALPIDPDHDELGLPPGISIVLGRDARIPVDAGEGDAGRYEIFVTTPTGEGVCVERRVPGDATLSRCGKEPKADRPFGPVVADAGVSAGKWLMYGYASPDAAIVELSDGTRVATSAVADLPGRYFSALIDTQPTVFARAFGQDGEELGTLGSDVASDLKPSSMEDAQALGDPAAFGPAEAPERKTFLLDGKHVPPNEVTSRGLVCSEAGGTVFICSDPRSGW